MCVVWCGVVLYDAYVLPFMRESRSAIKSSILTPCCLRTFPMSKLFSSPYLDLESVFKEQEEWNGHRKSYDVKKIDQDICVFTAEVQNR